MDSRTWDCQRERGLRLPALRNSRKTERNSGILNSPSPAKSLRNWITCVRARDSPFGCRALWKCAEKRDAIKAGGVRIRCSRSPIHREVPV